jgi:hypothetical protein
MSQSQLVIPRWGLLMMFAASVIGSVLLARQMWGS